MQKIKRTLSILLTVTKWSLIIAPYIFSGYMILRYAEAMVFATTVEQIANVLLSKATLCL